MLICFEIHIAGFVWCVVSDLLTLHCQCKSCYKYTTSLKAGVQVNQPHGNSLLMSHEIPGKHFLGISKHRLRLKSAELTKRVSFFASNLCISVAGKYLQAPPFILIPHARNMGKPKACIYGGMNNFS